MMSLQFSPLLQTIRHSMLSIVAVFVAVLCIMLLCHASATVARYYMLIQGHLPRVRVYQYSENTDCFFEGVTDPRKFMQRSASWLESCESGVYVGEEDTNVNKDVWLWTMGNVAPEYKFVFLSKLVLLVVLSLFGISCIWLFSMLIHKTCDLTVLSRLKCPVVIVLSNWRLKYILCTSTDRPYNEIQTPECGLYFFITQVHHLDICRNCAIPFFLDEENLLSYSAWKIVQLFRLG